MKFSKKRFVPALVLVALTIMMFVPESATAFSNVHLLTSSVPNVPSAASTITVPDDYPTITAAIGNASAGDTIIVRSGTYFENPVINKPLTLQGESTVVIGKGGSVGASVFTVAADNVRISGFTIKSLNYSASASYAYGILINADECTITGNNIVNTLSGIFCSVQSSTIIPKTPLRIIIRTASGSMEAQTTQSLKTT